jgi:DNA-binding CsgD family transcriptional regulator
LDAISIVEAAYDLELDTKGWLSRLLECAAPRLDRGLGMSAWEFDLQTGIDHSSRVWRGVDEGLRESWMKMARAEGGTISRRVHARGGNFRTATQNLGLTEDEARVFPPAVALFHPHGVRDVLAVSARDPGGRGVVLAAPMPDLVRPTGRERRPWARIAAHIEAGARLRWAISAGGLGDSAAAGTPGAGSDMASGAEAVLSPDGAIAHAVSSAKGVQARAELRRAARAIDRARSVARSDEDEALDLWQGLVAGRWSLVERFDHDGRRFFVARRNDPDVRDPRALTSRERQVLAYSAMGHRLKLIAYTLGLSIAAVSGHRTRAMRKLGLRSPADIVALFSGSSTP